MNKRARVGQSPVFNQQLENLDFELQSIIVRLLVAARARIAREVQAANRIRFHFRTFKRRMRRLQAGVVTYITYKSQYIHDVYCINPCRVVRAYDLTSY